MVSEADLMTSSPIYLEPGISLYGYSLRFICLPVSGNDNILVKVTDLFVFGHAGITLGAAVIINRVFTHPVYAVDDNSGEQAGVRSVAVRIFNWFSSVSFCANKAARRIILRKT